MNYILETIELLIYLNNMGYNGTYEAKYDFIKIFIPYSRYT